MLARPAFYLTFHACGASSTVWTSETPYPNRIMCCCRFQGAEIDFQVRPADSISSSSNNGTGPSASLSVFTTRPDTIFGATYMVVAPEHPLLPSLTSSQQQAEVQEYVRQATLKSDLERTELQKGKTGVFTGKPAASQHSIVHVSVVHIDAHVHIDADVQLAVHKGIVCLCRQPCSQSICRPFTATDKLFLLNDDSTVNDMTCACRQSYTSLASHAAVPLRI